jgi:phosphoesterase RecJ-like protein
LKIQFTEKNVAYIYTTADELQELNVDTFTVSCGMTNTMADIKGVDIWANFTETEKGVLCELRSSKYNINPIAVKYGGGGHAKASGATLKNKEEAMQLLEELKSLNM